MVVKDYLGVIHKDKLVGETFEESASIDQLRKGGKFLGDLIKARQLKVAVMCWISSSTLPLDPKVYNQVHTLYKNDMFWKIMNKKDSLPPLLVNQPTAMELALIAVAKATGGKEEVNLVKSAETSMVANQQLQQM